MSQTLTYRCPMCGYTHKDAMIHMDHSICEAKGGPPMPTNLRDMKFSDATSEQFKEFWEGEGWDYVEFCAAERRADNTVLRIDDEGDVAIMGVYIGISFETFGEALDALNELANTKIMGGWA